MDYPGGRVSLFDLLAGPRVPWRVTLRTGRGRGLASNSARYVRSADSRCDFPHVERATACGYLRPCQVRRASKDATQRDHL